MKVYRCCSDEEIITYKKGKVYKKNGSCGTNTFKYDSNKQYIHFFYFAECMYYYKKRKNGYYTKHFVQYDIPFDVLNKYFGYGFYAGIISGYYTPVPEFAIPHNKFKINYIKDIYDKEKDEYLRNTEWDAYKSSIPKEYLADFECGNFEPGYSEYSILDFSFNKVLSLSKK